MEFKKAAPEEVADVFDIYREAIRLMQASGIDQWDDLYPTQADIEQDIANGEMTLGLDGDTIACAFVLSNQQWQGYENGGWQYPDLPFSVLHRLCVNPACQGRGIGTKAMQYIEAQLKSEGIGVLKLDAFPQNHSAMKLYQKLGYTNVGETTFRKGMFNLFEKKL